MVCFMAQWEQLHLFKFHCLKIFSCEFEDLLRKLVMWLFNVSLCPVLLYWMSNEIKNLLNGALRTLNSVKMVRRMRGGWKYILLHIL